MYDDKLRAWVYVGSPGVFDTKIQLREASFPRVGEVVRLVWQETVLSAEVMALFEQRTGTKDGPGSKVVARAHLRLVGVSMRQF